MAYVRTFNKTAFIVRKTADNPSKFTAYDLAAMAGTSPAVVNNLVWLGVLEYTPKVKLEPKRKKGMYAVTLRVSRVGREKLDNHSVGGSLPPIVAK